MKKRTAIVAALVFLAGALLVVNTARAADASPLKIGLGEFKVDLSSQQVPAGTPIALSVTNTGKIEHELVIEKAGAVDEAIEISENNESKEGELEDIAPGETRTVTWVIDEPGAYQFACHVTGHYEAGMVKTITVISAAEYAQAEQTRNLALGGVGLLVGLVAVGGGLLIWRQKKHVGDKVDAPKP